MVNTDSQETTIHAHPVYIIAEAGVNHNGSLENARKLIDAAAEAGADAVKFQTFRAKKLVTSDAKTAGYQNKATGDTSQLEMLKKLELSESDHVQLIEHARQRNIQFLSTGFDDRSLEMLDRLGLPVFKVPSGEITNYPLLRTVASFEKPVIVSTGMATLEEIGQCVNLLTQFGINEEDLTILHCNTQYPTPMSDVNLSAMLTIAAAFPSAKIGYSDHTLGIEIPIAAVAMGATMIEKHFTLDRSMPGPDHAASLDPNELNAMVAAIRNLELARGNGIKEPSPSEKANLEVARRSIVAARDIKKGEVFGEDNLTAKRPGGGRSPMDWPLLIGTTADQDYREDEPVK